MDVPVLNMSGAEVGKLHIDAEKLGGEVNPALIKQAYVRYHAGVRQGSSLTLNRHDVEGSTKKIIKQKGSGGARHGDRKVPHFRGGSHAHHKQRTREDFRLDMPKKMRRKANLNALLAKLIDNEVKVIDTLSLSEPKTKAFRGFLDAIKVERSALVAVGQDNENVRKSARNLEGVGLCASHQLTCFEMLNHRYLVIEKKDLEAFLAGPSSKFDKSAKPLSSANALSGAAAGKSAKAGKASAKDKPAKSAKTAKEGA